MEYLKTVLEQPAFTLFIIIALGMWIGSFKVKRISLGSAGVLFMALIFGCLRQPIMQAVGYPAEPVVGAVAAAPKPVAQAQTATDPTVGLAMAKAELEKTKTALADAKKKKKNPISIPKEITDLGLLLFVAAVGLQAGPRFFGVFRRKGKAFLLIGIASTFAGALVTFILAKVVPFPAHMTNGSPMFNGAIWSGIYCGALTNTPALAAARELTGTLISKDAIEQVSIGYGLAYPFSVISVTLFVQFIPMLLKIRPADAAKQAADEEAAISPALERRKFVVSSADCVNKTVLDFQRSVESIARISRIKRGNQILVAKPDTQLQANDLVLVVGPTDEIDKIQPHIGVVTTESMADPSGSVISEEVVVSCPAVVGSTLRDLNPWEDYGIVVTRVRADGLEIAPTSGYEIHPADVLRIVGTKADVDAFVKYVGQEERRLEETSLTPIALGVAVGIAVGLLPIPLPGKLVTSLSMGGATFILSLLLGHFGKVGSFRVYMPSAAKHFAREFGLVVFLAGAGLGAGTQFIATVNTAGPQVLLYAALVTIATVLTAFFLLHKVMRWNMLVTCGTLSSVMTCPPALAASSGLADSDAPAIAFASIYPVAIISKILFVQVLVLLLRH